MLTRKAENQRSRRLTGPTLCNVEAKIKGQIFSHLQKRRFAGVFVNNMINTEIRESHRVPDGMHIFKAILIDSSVGGRKKHRC